MAPWTEVLWRNRRIRRGPWQEGEVPPAYNQSTQTGSGALTITTGVVGTTFTVTGLNFQPKALAFFWSGRATVGMGEGTINAGIGFAVSPSLRRVYSHYSDYAVTPPGMRRRLSDAASCIMALAPTFGVSVGRADLDAITSDGFRLIIDEQFTTAVAVVWIAFGGLGITDVALIDVTPPGAPGTSDYNVGFALDTGVDDKLVLISGGYFTGNLFRSWGMLGAVAGSTPQNKGTAWGSKDDNVTGRSPNPTDTFTYSRGDESFILSEGPDWRGAVSAWLPTGFRVTWAESPSPSFQWSALVLKGGRYQVGNLLTSTSGGNQVQATSYTPRGLLVVSHCKAESTLNVPGATHEVSIGFATSPTSRWRLSWLDKTGVGTDDCGVSYSTSDIYGNLSTGATIVEEGIMDLVSFDTTPPGFTWVMDDPDPSPAFAWYVVFADATGGGGGTPPSGSGLQTADGTLTITTAAVGTTFTVGGLPFQPKALLFFWSGRSTVGTGEATIQAGMGVATSPSSRRAFFTTTPGSLWTDVAVVCSDITDFADLDAILPDGFRLIVDQQFGAPLQVGWLALGGDDLTDVALVDFVNPASAGTQDITTVGFSLDTGLDDKLVLFVGGVNGAFPGGFTYGWFGVGAAAGSTPVNRGMYGYSSDAIPTDSATYSRAGESVVTTFLNAVHHRAGVSAWLNNGFRLTWVMNDWEPGVWRWSALVLKGGRYQVGDVLTSTGGTNQTEATTYVPKAVFLASHGKPESTAGVYDPIQKISLGVATSPTSRRRASWLDKDNVNPRDCATSYSEADLYGSLSMDATIVQDGALDMVVFNTSPPGFTWVMDDPDPSPAFAWYVVFSDPP